MSGCRVPGWGGEGACRPGGTQPCLHSQLPEEALLGHRLDSHDWEKISNVSVSVRVQGEPQALGPRGRLDNPPALQFEGGRSVEEIRKFWQNSEHPSINKQDWSKQEIEQLLAVAARHGHLQWQVVAEELGVRRPARVTHCPGGLCSSPRNLPVGHLGLLSLNPCEISQVSGTPGSCSCSL